ncbi:response regulator transcription factor [bacterium]|nr:response regulator transcription factor [bacterium]
MKEVNKGEVGIASLERQPPLDLPLNKVEKELPSKHNRMIRVYLHPKEEFPESLIAGLKALKDIHLSEEPVSADVLLLYAANYNRVTFPGILHTVKQFSKPSLLLYENGDDTFLKESLFQKSIEGAIRYDAATQQVFFALQAIAAGLRVFNNTHSNHRIPFSEVPSLTPRELEILRLIADGEGNKSIAYILEISEHTVKFHISSVFEKLHVSSRTEAIKKGIQQGLISI